MRCWPAALSSQLCAAAFGGADLSLMGAPELTSRVFRGGCEVLGRIRICLSDGVRVAPADSGRRAFRQLGSNRQGGKPAPRLLGATHQEVCR